MPKLKPVADIEAGLWTPTTGTSLYAMLDEEPRSDLDYITSAKTAPALSPVKFRASSDAVFGSVASLSNTIPATTEGGDSLYAFCFNRSNPTGPDGWTLFMEKRESTSTVFQWYQVYHKIAAGTPGAISPDAGTTVTYSQETASAMGLEIVALYAQNGTPVILDDLKIAEIGHGSANPGLHTIQQLTVAGASRLAMAVSVCASGPGPNDPRAYYDTTLTWVDTGAHSLDYHRLTIGYRYPADGEVLGMEGGTQKSFSHSTSPHNAIEATMVFTNDVGGGISLPLGLQAFYRNDDGENNSALSTGGTPNILDRISDYTLNRYHIQKGSVSGSDANDATWNATGLGYVLDDYSTLPSGLLTAWAPATADYTLVILGSWNSLAATFPMIAPNQATDGPGVIRNNASTLQGIIGGTTLTGGALTINTWAMLHARRSGVNGDIGINGTVTASSAAVVNGTAPTTVTLGANPGASQHLDGNQAAVLLFNRALTDAELANEVYAWLKVNIATPRGITLP